jgi:chaperonin cofactor prefoldin
MEMNVLSSDDETGKRIISGYPHGYGMWPPAWPVYAAPYGYPPAYPVAKTVEAELNMLGSYKEQLEAEREAINDEIDGIEARIDELHSLIEEGEPMSAARYTSTPFWGPAFYGPATPQLERQTLERRAEVLKQHIEDIRKRLEELQGGG